MSFDTVIASLFGSSYLRIWPVYIGSMIVIALIIHMIRRPKEGFFRWLFPAGIYFHPSHFTDIKLFLFGRLLSLIGIFNILAASSAIALLIVDAVGGNAFDTELPVWAITILIVLAGDFATYLVHRVHHENEVIWPFHSVHHSAEVMTPITVYRKHPVYDLISSLTRGVLIGAMQGLLLALFVDEVSLWLILGTNGAVFTFNLLGANLRHSHIWLSYGRVLEHILISPAQHQIHHSLAPEHHNKNYGEIFAIWDWMFGTLYIPSQEEKLEFGLADASGARLKQPHTSLMTALLVPFQDSFAAARRLRRIGRTLRHRAR